MAAFTSHTRTHTHTSRHISPLAAGRAGPASHLRLHLTVDLSAASPTCPTELACVVVTSWDDYWLCVAPSPPPTRAKVWEQPQPVWEEWRLLEADVK